MDKFLKKVHRVIIFNQNAWLKSYINMNRSKKKAENDIEDFFKLMSNDVFGKTWKMWENISDVKLVTTKRKRNYLVSEPNFNTTKFLTENLLVIEIKKLKYLGFQRLSILELSKINVWVLV